jgi:hypothetical protein
MVKGRSGLTKLVGVSRDRMFLCGYVDGIDRSQERVDILDLF